MKSIKRIRIEFMLLFSFLFFSGCIKYKYFDINGHGRVRHHTDLFDRPEHIKNKNESKNYTYYLPDGICQLQDTFLTSVLKNYAKNIFWKTQNPRKDWSQMNCELIMTSDSTGYFDFGQRILHGYRKYTYFKNECIIVFSAGSSY